MSSTLGNIYQTLFKEYTFLYDKYGPADVQAKLNERWNSIIKVEKKENRITAAKKLLEEIRQETTKKKAQRTLNFFKPSGSKKTDTFHETIAIEPLQNVADINNFDNVENKTIDSTSKDSTQITLVNFHYSTNSTKETVDFLIPINFTACSLNNVVEIPPSGQNKRKSYKTPVQDAVQEKISNFERDLQIELLKQNAGLATIETKKNIKELQKNIDQEKNHLKILQQSAKRQKTHRDVKNSAIKEFCIINPKSSKKLKVHANHGRPSLEVQQPELLKTIVNLVTFGASAHDKRRNETLNSCKTLTDLHKELLAIGFQISRAGTYLRLRPRQASSNEGKKHITTVPVRLKRAQTNKHKNHLDQNFCTATIRSLEILASILGPDQCIFLSQDDKARVPLGITAANKQAPILMHLDYEIRLPDHDWVVAEKHKLIPSVYALIVIKPDQLGIPDAVTYSGPTYISIRSGKHSASTASTHALDFDRLFEIEECKNMLINEKTGTVKPIVFLSVDGGPDENPRYQKVIRHVIGHFIKYDLDAIYVFTNAPGRSAYNRVERRMAPLSKELSGVILEHDHFGTHLSKSGETINIELEKQNFKYAGNVLAEIWNNMIIDKFQVFAEYKDLEEEMLMPELPDAEWYSKHVRESQYLLQVIKCSDISCCSPHRSGLISILKERFLPPPYSLSQTSTGLNAPSPNPNGFDDFAPLLMRIAVDIKPDTGNFKLMPYDFFCPSVQKDLKDRTCDNCGIYFVTKKGLKYHREQLHKKNISFKKVRPNRIIKRRDEELLCLFHDEDNIVEVVEWVEKEALNTDGIDLPIEKQKSDLPLIDDIVKWSTNPFEEDF